jgi:hypothetical protein
MLLTCNNRVGSRDTQSTSRSRYDCSTSNVISTPAALASASNIFTPFEATMEGCAEMGVIIRRPESSLEMVRISSTMRFYFRQILVQTSEQGVRIRCECHTICWAHCAIVCVASSVCSRRLSCSVRSGDFDALSGRG